jgi:nucleoside-diphosphate-sugar epimerase
VPTTVIAALRDAPIMIFGDGQQRNDYIYVKDVACNLVKALKNDRLDSHKVWHVGSGRSTSALEIVQLIIKLTGSKSEIVINGCARSGESISTVVADRAHLIDPHYQFTPLEAGLRSTIDYFRAHGVAAEPTVSLAKG